MRKILNKDEFNAFKGLFSILGLGEKDVVGLNDHNLKNKINEQYRELSRKYHPDKNSNDQEAGEKFKLITPSRESIEEFVINPLQKGLSKRNNLMKELRSTLNHLNLETLRNHLDENGRKKFFDRMQQANNRIITYSKFFGYLNIPGTILTFVLPIIFFCKNGISYNIPLALGFFVPLLMGAILSIYVRKIYIKNHKEFKTETTVLLLTNFDEECKDFSESDRTKLKWVKNLTIINTIISFSLLSCGVGLDLASNGIGIINSMLLFGLLLSLPVTLLLITTPLLGIAINNNYKNYAIDLIQEQFRGDDQSIEVDNKNSVVSTNMYVNSFQFIVDPLNCKC